MIQIRPLAAQDYDAWYYMWSEYCEHFADNEIGADASPFAFVTETLWQRLVHPEGPIRGLIAAKDGQVVGFCHYVLHVHSWGVGKMCHCEDLFVLPAHRDSAIGTDLLLYLQRLGREQEWDRIYGTTDTANEGARRLYSRFVKEDERRIFQFILVDYGWN